MSKTTLILVVEDDPIIGADLCLTLANYGYLTIGPIATGEQALLEVQNQTFALILMDINLAGKLDGIATAEQTQTIRATPIVFLSALSDEASLQRAKLVNPFGYLIKPFDAAELRATIEITLQRFAQEISDVDKKALEQLPIPFTQVGLANEEALHYLLQFNIFKNIPSDAVTELSKLASIKEFEAGQFIINEGQESEGVFAPFSGRISITKTAESGKELIVALLAPGDPFGLIYNLPSIRRTTSAKSQIDSKVIWIGTAAWQHFCQRNPIMYHNLADLLAERLAASYTFSSSLAHAKVEQRIVSTLVSLSADIGKSSRENVKQSRVYITRKELSEITGTTPETAIRVTKNLERQGILDLTRPGIIKILDITALKSAHTSKMD